MLEGRGGTVLSRTDRDPSRPGPGSRRRRRRRGQGPSKWRGTTWTAKEPLDGHDFLTVEEKESEVLRYVWRTWHLAPARLAENAEVPLPVPLPLPAHAVHATCTVGPCTLSVSLSES